MGVLLENLLNNETVNLKDSETARKYTEVLYTFAASTSHYCVSGLRTADEEEMACS